MIAVSTSSVVPQSFGVPPVVYKALVHPLILRPDVGIG